MKRREFITLLGGAAATWPLAVRAQQGERMRRIAALLAIEESDPQAALRVAALQKGLQETGWTANRNIRVDYRFGGGDRARMRELAAELAASAPEVIVAGGTGSLQVLRPVT